MISNWASPERLLDDTRFSLRLMRKAPAYTAAAIFTLALGIGANTAIFSLVRSILLQPLAYRDPERLVTLLNRGTGPASAPDLADLQRQSRSFERITAAGGWSGAITGRERPEEVIGLQLTEGTFEMLGIAPLYGRTPAPEECRPGKEHVVVLSYRLWQRLFGGDRGALGQKLTINGEPYTVIGIMPRHFQYTPFWITEAEMWAPLPLEPDSGNRWKHYLRVVARLKPGVELAQAQAEVTGICRRLERDYPDSDTGLDIRVERLRDKVVGDVRPALLVLLGAVGLVLLIACSNVAGLALARSAERRREIAIRLALGAGRRRVLRQMLTESVLAAVLGGALGLGLAQGCLSVVKPMIVEGADRYRSRVPRLEEVQLDPAVLAFTALLSLTTGVLFGAVPAFQAARSDVNSALKEAGRGASEGRHGLRMRNSLVVAEVAISLVLLAGAGLLLRSFARLRTVDPGFDPGNVLTMTVSVAGQKQMVGPARAAFYDQVVERVRALPGVEAASMTNHLPLGGDMWSFDVWGEGLPIPPPGRNTGVIWRVCRPDYFATMRIQLLRGRDFTSADRAGTPRVAIINERLAKLFWGSQDPIGKRLTNNDPRRNPVWVTVVGVIRDAKQSSWAGEPDNEMYIPFAQDESLLSGTHPWVAYMTLVLRIRTAPLSAAGAVRRAIWSLDKDAAVSDVRSFDQVISASLWQARFQLLVLGTFAVFAVLLAAVGIYGVMGYAVNRRAHEIGIRMALGARRAEVVWLVLRQVSALMAAGIVIGLAAAIALTRSLATLLYGVSATDPLTFSAVPLALAAVALLAGYIPARRASAIDPAIVLRSE